MRPSVKELTGKIRQAREKASGKQWMAADYRKLAAQFDELNCYTEEEQNQALEAALNEVQPGHYTGPRPPGKSHEEACKEAEMFAFAWESRHFACPMYVKFAFVQETLFLISLHKAKW